MDTHASVLDLPIEIQFIIIDLAGVDSAVPLFCTCKHLQVLTARRITIAFLKSGRDRWRLVARCFNNMGPFLALMKTIDMACLYYNEDEWAPMRDELKDMIVDYKGTQKARHSCVSQVHSKVLAILIHLLFETYCINSDPHALAQERILGVLEAIVEEHESHNWNTSEYHCETKWNKLNMQRQESIWHREPDRLDNLWLRLACGSEYLNFNIGTLLIARDNRRVIKFCLDERQYIWRERPSSWLANRLAKWHGTDPTALEFYLCDTRRNKLVRSARFIAILLRKRDMHTIRLLASRCIQTATSAREELAVKISRFVHENHDGDGCPPGPCPECTLDWADMMDLLNMQAYGFMLQHSKLFCGSKRFLYKLTWRHHPYYNANTKSINPQESVRLLLALQDKIKNNS